MSQPEFGTTKESRCSTASVGSCPTSCTTGTAAAAVPAAGTATTAAWPPTSAASAPTRDDLPVTPHL